VSRSGRGRKSRRFNPNVGDVFFSARRYASPTPTSVCICVSLPQVGSVETSGQRELVLGMVAFVELPTVIYLPYRVSGSTLTAVGRSQLLVRWPGTQSRIFYGIQRAAQTVLGVYLKRTCSRVTSASSALRVLNDYALYKSMHALTHSYTVLYLTSKSEYVQK